MIIRSGLLSGNKEAARVPLISPDSQGDELGAAVLQFLKICVSLSLYFR